MSIIYKLIEGIHIMSEKKEVFYKQYSTVYDKIWI